MKIQIEITAQSKMHEHILAHSIQGIYAVRKIQQMIGWTLTAGTPIDPDTLHIKVTKIEAEGSDG